ncbi:MAG: mismatch repair protein MutL [Candidatus Woesearchaeota archaeon]|nr:mismatch repair protein MutL [Candidatus Woesearchaeota archaeon]
MGLIKKLPEELVAKIAAGEVIERPASVVKELVENSIDAEADKISVVVKNGGKDEIRVSDNGIGMSRDDLLLSIERHATSKITKEEDLYEIKTLGFRGEALASIASVSNLSIITKKADEKTGFKLQYPDLKIEEVAAQNGTTVIVKDLFYNTPARKKYLKSEATELNRIMDIMIDMALANKEIEFRLYKNKTLLLQAPKGIDEISRISYIYNDYIAKNLIPIHFENEFIKIEGYAGKPTVARGSSDYQRVFVNDRAVKSKLIIDAATEAYQAMLFLKRKPVLIIKLYLDPRRIDVNVHPTKREIRFDNEQLVYFSVHEAVKNALDKSNLIEKGGVSYSFHMREKSFGNHKRMEQKARYPMLKEYNRPLYASSLNAEEKEKQTNLEINNIVEEKKSAKRYRILGQIHKTYIVAESDEGLAIIDQHAAHERINYEKVRREFYNAKVESQMLIKPVVLNFGIPKAEMLNERKDYLKKLGFEINEFGKGEIIVRSIPSILKGIKEDEISSIIEELVENFKDKKPQQLVDERNLYTIACKMSIKAGDELNAVQMKDLIEKLFNCENAFTCPHGRPTIIELNEVELEKLFKRRA